MIDSAQLPRASLGCGARDAIVYDSSGEWGAGRGICPGREQRGHERGCGIFLRNIQKSPVESLQHSHRPLAGFNDPTSKEGEERKGTG